VVLAAFLNLEQFIALLEFVPFRSLVVALDWAAVCRCVELSCLWCLWQIRARAWLGVEAY